MYVFVAKCGKGSHDFRRLLGQLVSGEKDKGGWTSGGWLGLQKALAKSLEQRGFSPPSCGGGRVLEEVVDTQLSCLSLSSLVLVVTVSISPCIADPIAEYLKYLFPQAPRESLSIGRL